jgi:hypothetical protein
LNQPINPASLISGAATPSTASTAWISAANARSVRMGQRRAWADGATPFSAPLNFSTRNGNAK